MRFGIREKNILRIRQLFFIYSFIFICIWCVLWTVTGRFDHFGEEFSAGKKQLQANEQNDQAESTFKFVTYYLTQKKIPFVNFNARELVLAENNKKATGMLTNGLVYRSDDLTPIKFQADKTTVLFSEKEVFLENRVKVNFNNIYVDADKMNLYFNRDLLEARGNIVTHSTGQRANETVVVNSDNANYKSRENTIEYLGKVRATFKRQKAYEESIHFSAGHLFFDGNKGLANFLGSVHLNRENIDVFANAGELYLANYNKRLKYYSLYDDVRLEEHVNSSGKVFTRKAFAEKLEGIMSERRIILTGFPKVFQEKDVIKGNKIIIKENIETVEVDDANTSIILQDTK